MRFFQRAFALSVVAFSCAASAQCPATWPAFEQAAALEKRGASLGVGRNQIVAVDDDRIRFYDKCSNALVNEQVLDGPGGFFESAGAVAAGSLVNPRVLYDRTTGRFFVFAHTLTPEPCLWYIGFTPGEDATSLWYRHEIQSPFGIWFQRNGQVAVDSVDIWLSAGVLNGGAEWILGRIDKPLMLANPTNPPALYWLAPQTLAVGDYEVPAQRVSFESNNPQYAVDIQGPDVNAIYDEIHLYAYRFQTTPGVVDKLGPAIVPVPPYTNGLAPVQPSPGQPLAVDSEARPWRFQSAAFRGGRVWAAHAVGVSNNNAGVNRMVIRWYCFNMNNWAGDPTGPQPTLEQTGVIDGGPGTWAFSPSITVTRTGDVGITYNQCGWNEYLSIRQRSRCATDPPNTMSTSQVLYQAAEAYAPDFPQTNPTPWAQFTTTTSDPSVSNRMWSSHFGLKPVVPGGGAPTADKWLTRIARFEPACLLDVNGNGASDASDLPALVQAMQAGEPEGDIVLDQVIDASDLAAFQQLNGPK